MFRISVCKLFFCALLFGTLTFGLYINSVFAYCAGGIHCQAPACCFPLTTCARKDCWDSESVDCSYNTAQSMCTYPGGAVSCPSGTTWVNGTCYWVNDNPPPPPPSPPPACSGVCCSSDCNGQDPSARSREWSTPNSPLFTRKGGSH